MCSPKTLLPLRLSTAQMFWGNPWLQFPQLSRLKLNYIPDMHPFIFNCVFYHVPTLCEALRTQPCSRRPRPRGRYASLMKTLVPGLLSSPPATPVTTPGRPCTRASCPRGPGLLAPRPQLCLSCAYLWHILNFILMTVMLHCHFTVTQSFPSICLATSPSSPLSLAGYTGLPSCPEPQ